MGIFQKMVLGGATIAAMSTGQVQAAENSTPMDNPDAAKTETVVAPKDTVINSDNVLDLSNEFIAKQFETQEVITEQFEIQAPGTIEDLKETLSSPTNLTDDQQKHIDLWSDYIVSNPQDPVSREAFVALKEATDEVANKWIKIDQYYQYVETAGSYDDLKSSKENLIKNMDAMLEKSQVRENIPEANVEYHRGRPAKDYALLRLYNQFLLLDYMEKNPGMMKEYVRLRDSNDKNNREQAKLIEASCYKTYGIDINKCYTQNIDNVRNIVAREKTLLNKEFKEEAYEYCLHHALDKAFSENETAIHAIDMVYVDNKPFFIDGKVALSIDGYAKLVAQNARGRKLNKAQKDILHDSRHSPPELRDALTAYYSACTVKFTREMNKPKGEYVTYVNTNNISEIEATQYVNLLRLGDDYTVSGKNQMTDNDRETIAYIEKYRPDLKQARERYEENMELQKQQFAEAMDRPAGENVTVHDRYGFTADASSNYFENKGLSYTPVDQDATTYINMLRLGEGKLTDENRAIIENIEKNRPDLAICRKSYEAQRNQQNTQQQSATHLAQNVVTR